MTTFVALLRGINVGRAKRLPMVELRAVLEGLGCADVLTILNSGNAILDHPSKSAASLASELGRALHGRFGFDVPVVVKSARDLHDIAAGNPLAGPDIDPSKLLVIFAQAARPPAALGDLAASVSPRERFVLGARAAYLHCPDGILASAAAERALSKLGATVTTRNWSTVLRVVSALRARQATA